MSQAPEEVLLALLRRSAEERGQRQTAHEVGMAPGQLNKWLTGKAQPNPELATLKDIAEGLGLPVWALLTDEPTVPPRPKAEEREMQELARLLRAAGRIVDRELKRRRLGEIIDPGEEPGREAAQ